MKSNTTNKQLRRNTRNCWNTGTTQDKLEKGTQWLTRHRWHDQGRAGNQEEVQQKTESEVRHDSKQQKVTHNSRWPGIRTLVNYRSEAASATQSRPQWKNSCTISADVFLICMTSLSGSSFSSFPHQTYQTSLDWSGKPIVPVGRWLLLTFTTQTNARLEFQLWDVQTW